MGTFFLIVFAMAFCGIFLFLWADNSAHDSEVKEHFYKLSEIYGFPAEGVNSTELGFCRNSEITFYCTNGGNFISDRTFFYFWKKMIYIIFWKCLMKSF